MTAVIKKNDKSASYRLRKTEKNNYVGLSSSSIQRLMEAFKTTELDLQPSYEVDPGERKQASHST